MKPEGSDTKKRVLFLCTGNSARSQMAEGLLRSMAGDQFDVASAGTRPVGLNPYAVAVMKELGIDISRQRSKSVEEFVPQPFDCVVTVCDQAKEVCPVFHGARTCLHWSFEDPAALRGTNEERLAIFRKVRDEIASTVRRFIEQGAVEQISHRGHGLKQ